MEITKLPARILKNKLKAVSPDDIKKGAFKELVLSMKQAMQDNQGVGLAANQVGLDLSIFVIDETLAEQTGIPAVYFNPEITDYSKDRDDLEEGCLSIPEFFTPVKRSRKIMIKFIDENGEKRKLKVRGFAARVLQHETDHLNGLTIKNRAEKN